MAILHILFLAFTPTIPAADQTDICTRLLALQNKCVHPTSGARYLKSYGGGANNSPEKLNAEFTHAFVFEFGNEEDRKYYLERDPAHLEFVASLEGKIGALRVLDFEPGKF